MTKGTRTSGLGLVPFLRAETPAARLMQKGMYSIQQHIGVSAQGTAASRCQRVDTACRKRRANGFDAAGRRKAYHIAHKQNLLCDIRPSGNASLPDCYVRMASPYGNTLGCFPNLPEGFQSGNRNSRLRLLYSSDAPSACFRHRRRQTSIPSDSLLRYAHIARFYLIIESAQSTNTEKSRLPKETA